MIKKNPQVYVSFLLMFPYFIWKNKEEIKNINSSLKVRDIQSSGEMYGKNEKFMLHQY